MWHAHKNCVRVVRNFKGVTQGVFFMGTTARELDVISPQTLLCCPQHIRVTSRVDRPLMGVLKTETFGVEVVLVGHYLPEQQTQSILM